MKKMLSLKNFIWCIAVTGTLIVTAGFAVLSVSAAEAGSDGESLASASEPEAAAAAETQAGDEVTEAAPQPVPEQEIIQNEAAPKPAANGEISVMKEKQDGDGENSDSSITPNDQKTKDEAATTAAGQQPPSTKELDENTQKSDLKIVVEDDTQAAAKKTVNETELVEAPPIVPEGSAIDNNIFGSEGQYYVTIPKSMSFKKLANGDYETLQSSYYTVNSGMASGNKLSVKVSGINTDDTVQLSSDITTMYRKAEVSTMPCDIWQYRPDGTVLNVVEADPTGYGKELVLDGPGKFKAKCKLKRYADDVLSAGTWSGSILFTVTCTPDSNAKNGQQANDTTKTADKEAASTDSAAKDNSAAANNDGAAAPSGDVQATSDSAGNQAAGFQATTVNQPAAAPTDPATALGTAGSQEAPAAPTTSDSSSGSQEASSAAPAASGSQEASSAAPAAIGSQDAPAVAAGDAATQNPENNSVDASSVNQSSAQDASSSSQQESAAEASQESIQNETDAMAPTANVEASGDAVTANAPESSEADSSQEAVSNENL